MTQIAYMRLVAPGSYLRQKAEAGSQGVYSGWELEDVGKTPRRACLASRAVKSSEHNCPGIKGAV